MSAPRRTLINPAEVDGIGLFTARAARVRFLPAPAGTGLLLRRADVPGSPEFPATLGSLAEAPRGIPARNTTLRAPGHTVEAVTVEHALSALIGLGITDIIVELSGAEVPILDGSAAPFVAALWAAGLRYAGEQIEPLIIAREVTISGANGASITARPRAAAGCVYTYHLDYGTGAPIPVQSATFDTQTGDYVREVAPARTFCTLAEAEAMRKAGLFGHLSPRDMLVIGESGPIDNAYRFENEPARHKLLDVMGDLALVGRPIQGEIIARKSGHAMNHQMAGALLAGG